MRHKHANKILPYPIRYVTANKTNIAATFARIRREQKDAADAQAKADEEAQAKVRVIGKRGRA